MESNTSLLDAILAGTKPAIIDDAISIITEFIVVSIGKYGLNIPNGNTIGFAFRKAITISTMISPIAVPITPKKRDSKRNILVIWLFCIPIAFRTPMIRFFLDVFMNITMPIVDITMTTPTNVVTNITTPNV